MGYCVRGFCKSRTVPTLAEVEDVLRRTLPSVRFDTEDARDSPSWRSADFNYDEDRGPIVVEIDFNDGPESLAVTEGKEFIDEVSDLDDSDAKERVIEHLRDVNYIVRCQLLGDVDESGFEANGQLLDIFVENHGGLIQADGAGFYEGTDLVVALK